MSANANPYSPHTDADRREMLAAIGVRSVDDLIGAIPADARRPRLGLPEGMSEADVQALVDGVAAKLRRRTVRRAPARFQFQPQIALVRRDDLQPRRLTHDGKVRCLEFRLQAAWAIYSTV